MNKKFQSLSIKDVYEKLTNIDIKKLQDALDTKYPNSFFTENWARFGEFIDEVKNDYRECVTNTEVYKDSIKEFYKLNEEKIVRYVIDNSKKGPIFSQKAYLQSLKINKIRPDIKKLIIKDYWNKMTKTDRVNLPFRFINCVHKDDPTTSLQSYCSELVDYFYKN